MNSQPVKMIVSQNIVELDAFLSINAGNYPVISIGREFKRFFD